MSVRPCPSKHAGNTGAIHPSAVAWPSTVAVIVGLTLGCGSQDMGDPAGGQTTISRPMLVAELPEEVAAIADNLYSESPADRAYAASELGRLGKEAQTAVPLLIDRLEDPDWQVRRQAAEALGTVGDGSAVKPLIDVLSDRNGEWAVRTAAARSLGELGDARAVEPLVAVLNDMNAHVRHMAVIALGQIGTPETLEPLAAASSSDSDAATRFSAAEALGRLEASKVEESP